MGGGGGGGEAAGGLFSVEKAICPSVSSQRPEPTGRKADGYLKVGRMGNEEEEGMTKGRRSKQLRDREIE